MATYSRSERVIRRVEFHVPTYEPWGACWAEVYKAVNAAIAELRDAGIDPPSDDQIRIHGADAEIVVAYEVPDAR